MRLRLTAANFRCGCVRTQLEVPIKSWRTSWQPMHTSGVGKILVNTQSIPAVSFPQQKIPVNRSYRFAMCYRSGKGESAVNIGCVHCFLAKAECPHQPDKMSARGFSRDLIRDSQGIYQMFVFTMPRRICTLRLADNMLCGLLQSMRPEAAAILP